MGDPEEVNPRIVQTLAANDFIPVVAPLGISRDGITYNINADTFASELAAALKAKRLLLLTDVAGVLDKDKKLIHHLSVSEAKAMIADGTITGGMIPKVEGCIERDREGRGRRGDPGWPGAACGAAGAVHRARRRHADRARLMADGAPGQSRVAQAFRDTRLWIFDLDNTLYPSECNLFAEIDRRMSAFIQNLLGLDPAAARKVQKELYYEHGTTLSGLMAEHGVKPDDFMDYVHDIDLSPVQHAPELAEAIARLEGRKFIFTNGSVRHAERVAEKLGVLDKFDGIYDIAAGGYVPKPKPEAFKRFLEFCEGVNCKAAMFEDLPHNLEPAHALGIVTVLVKSDYLDHPSQQALKEADELPHYIQFETGDLTGFLKEVAGTSRLYRPGAVKQV